MRQIAYGGGQMERREYVIYSSHLKKDMHIIQYGHSGLPIIGFPTQCAPCTNYEDFGATRVLEPYFEEGQMQLFCVVTVDGESWCCKDGINTWRSARQESYHRFIVDEVIPFIWARHRPRSHFSEDRSCSAAYSLCRGYMIPPFITTAG